MLVSAEAGDAVAGLFWALDHDQEASLERVALTAFAAGKRRTAGDVRPQAARNTVPTQALGGPGIGPFEVPALVPHALGDEHIVRVQCNRAPAIVAPAMRVLGDADDVPILVNPDLAPGFVPGDIAVHRAVFAYHHGLDVLLDPLLPASKGVPNPGGGGGQQPRFGSTASREKGAGRIKPERNSAE